MSTPDLISLTLEQANEILKRFDCLKREIVPAAERDLMRHALLRVAQASDYQMLGVCADDQTQGQQSLVAYAKALGYVPQLKMAAIEGPIYIKFNPKSGLCYASPYIGEHRGVLVSCQSAYETGINEMYGHLPLDLFQLEQ